MVGLDATSFGATAVGGYKAQWDGGFYLRFGVRSQHANSNRIRVEEQDSLEEGTKSELNDYTKKTFNSEASGQSSGGLDFLVGLAF